MRKLIKCVNAHVLLFSTDLKQEATWHCFCSPGGSAGEFDDHVTPRPHVTSLPLWRRFVYSGPTNTKKS